MQMWKIATIIWIAAGAPSQATPDKLTVALLDYAAIPRTVLRRAAELAEEAIQKAGVDTDWIVCQVSSAPRQSCVLPPSGTYVLVKILPAGHESRVASIEALGYALPCPTKPRCTASGVFYWRVVEFAESFRGSVSAALAYVIAHEIGHLMGLGHSRGGVMKANLDGVDLRQAETGRLRFSAEDAKRFQASLASWKRTTANAPAR